MQKPYQDKESLIRHDLTVETKQLSLEPRFVIKTDEDHRKMFGLAKEMLRAIVLEVFYPNPGWQCEGCPFSTACCPHKNSLILNGLANM